jgi:hypothetical protein
MRTATPFAKLGLAGLFGLLGWFATPATPALAHGRGYDHGRGGGEHFHAYQGERGGGWRRGGPAVEVRVAPSFHPGFGGRGFVAPHRVWVPGFWNWRANHRIWVEGAWALPPQDNMVWVAPQWIWDERVGQWVWSEGHWAPGAY